ncbi:thioredoxin domain-containing protein [Neptuniibacter sp.]|uniref:thioredoxin domain-containing protein n=1 Tax=Neptuniibacter sp. TaxID=1962643 RepID=UPI0026335B5F|nr:thioredoxin domain-containing protein [Neptuniibacter sp.]MCP4596938.1 thioredoxin domain-containing protein [Neptuniibacter sp.]
MHKGKWTFFIPLALIATLGIPITGKANEIKLIPPALQHQLQLVLDNKSLTYQPRTKHLTESGGPRFTNRLLLESSPYLQQHAHNPVNWYSWSKEALDKAKQKNKPIFLSIGYSTCHWCHVMEEESFEDLEIAAFLNEHFISIKVDREQLPDIDETYMLAAAMISGQTGWPLNAFNTPEAEPFFAGTYFPPKQFLQLLQRIKKLWHEEQTEIRVDASNTLSAIKRISSTNKSESNSVSYETLAAATEQWLELADELQGGFGTAPKFPNEPALFLLFDQAIRTQDQALLETLNHTLEAIHQGGIYDQVGGGFHRYAIDPEWLIPHFEKMLYNQAQLSRIYLQAYEISGNPLFERTAQNTLEYVLREMRNKQGLFYSATDADSEGEEGRFFLWNEAELKEALSDQEFQLAFALYGLENGSNFDGKNILYLPNSLPEVIVSQGYKVNDFFKQLNSINQKLLAARQLRPHPHLDNKVITAWNGMMIRALAEAGSTLGEVHYLQAAINASDTLWQQHFGSSGLLRDRLDNIDGQPANLEDYAYFAVANISLYDSTGNQEWLKRAQILTDDMLKLFWDEQNEIMYLSRADTLLPVRARSRGDNAIASGESIAYEALLLLAKRQPNQRYLTTAQRMLQANSGNVSRNPMQYSYLLKAFGQNSSYLNRVQYAAQGALKAELTSTGTGYILKIQLAPGWHINAEKPGHKKLIGSSVSAEWVEKVSYPKAESLALSFASQDINLFTGEFDIHIQAKQSKKVLDELLSFTFQACSDTQCLAPETLKFSAAIQ